MFSTSVKRRLTALMVGEEMAARSSLCCSFRSTPCFARIAADTGPGQTWVSRIALGSRPTSRIVARHACCRTAAWGIFGTRVRRPTPAAASRAIRDPSHATRHPPTGFYQLQTGFTTSAATARARLLRSSFWSEPRRLADCRLLYMTAWSWVM